MSQRRQGKSAHTAERPAVTEHEQSECVRDEMNAQNENRRELRVETHVYVHVSYTLFIVMMERFVYAACKKRQCVTLLIRPMYLQLRMVLMPYAHVQSPKSG